MRILVYVEGPSDRAALEALLAPLVDAGRGVGVGIRFVAVNGKQALLDKVPGRAADHLGQNPGDWIVALPDLYPMAAYRGTPNAHGSASELRGLLRARFDARADRAGLPAAARARFVPHCLVHDLGALILASPDRLRARLGTKDRLKRAWRSPVESQNDDEPPKRVVEALFRKYGKKGKGRYIDTIDAPWILRGADLAELRRACPEGFGAFVAFLEGVVDGPSGVRSAGGA